MAETPPAAPTDASETPAGSSISFRTFGQYSQFLRAAMADEESLQLGEGLQEIANQIEHVAGLLHQPPPERNAIARSLVELLDALREHRHQVQELGSDWHATYEFKSHFHALTQFRSLVTRWASESGPPRNQPPSGEEFELTAWRLLGAGALLLDAFEQTGARALQNLAAAENTRPSGWWGRFLSVLHLKP